MDGALGEVNISVNSWRTLPPKEPRNARIETTMPKSEIQAVEAPPVLRINAFLRRIYRLSLESKDCPCPLAYLEW
jgi:hypothetical protein